MENSKLRMAIERELHTFVENIKEHAIDFTVLYVRRNLKDQIDTAQMAKVLEIVRQAIDDGFMNTIDTFLGRVDAKINEASNQSSPNG
jgi:hypothetical protein